MYYAGVSNVYTIDLQFYLLKFIITIACRLNSIKKIIIIIFLLIKC